MNLIERFGYDGVKRRLRDNGSLHSERLKKILLDHRRKHKIFEIGDLYVFTEKYSKHSAIHKVDSLKSGKGCIRHATDEEIAAGRRL